MAEAESLYRDSLTLDPNHADSLNCLGILAHQCGRNDAALELIGRAIAVQERNPQYHYNIALVLAAAGRMDDAVAHNQRAIALKPDYTDAHTNLASALASQGKWSEAEVHFRRTLSQNPQSSQAYGNLAGALQAQGKQDEALGIITRGLAVAETDDLKAIFALCLQEQKSVPKVDKLRTYVERALVNGWARPSDLANFVTALIKQSDTVRHALVRSGEAQTAASAQEIHGPRALAALAGDRLLQAFLESTPVCDTELEQLLTDARHAALDLATAANQTKVSDDVLKACCALAQQCFINEYVFAAGPEMERAAALRDQIAAALAAGQPVEPLAVAVAASYAPLHAIAGAQALAERPWPEARGAPDHAAGARARAGAGTPLGDPRPHAGRRQRVGRGAAAIRGEPVSALGQIRDAGQAIDVRRSYSQPASAAPCPAARQGRGRDIDRGLRHRPRHDRHGALVRRRQDPRARPQPRQPELRATKDRRAEADQYRVRASRHSQARVARTYVRRHRGHGRVANARRSRCRLARAARGASAGRLHADRALPRAAARDDVRAARDFAAARGYRPNADDIRKCRQDLMGPDAPALAKAVARYQDFFATSECRDLLFPAQDHEFTIAGDQDVARGQSLSTSSASRKRHMANMPSSIPTTAP